MALRATGGATAHVAGAASYKVAAPGTGALEQRTRCPRLESAPWPRLGPHGQRAGSPHPVGRVY